MWVGEQINEKGVGNGISIVLLINIVSRIPSDMTTLYESFMKGKIIAKALLSGVIIAAIIVGVVILVIILNGAERRIPVQYSKKMQGRKMMGGQSSHIPLKVNTAGVIPVIFASSIITAPQIVLSFVNTGAYQKVSGFLSLQKPFGLVLYAVLTFLFTFFYTDLQVDPDKIAENLGKSGAYIPGIRPGSETRTYLKKVIHRITVLGAVALTIMAVLPYLLPMVTSLPTSVSVGGTGIIIVVGVAMETMSQLKGQLTQKQYRGFLK